jgi:hypothetical protein
MRWHEDLFYRKLIQLRNRIPRQSFVTQSAPVVFTSAGNHLQADAIVLLPIF